MAKHQHIESEHDHGLLLGYQYTTNFDWLLSVGEYFFNHWPAQPHKLGENEVLVYFISPLDLLQVELKPFGWLSKFQVIFKRIVFFHYSSS